MLYVYFEGVETMEELKERYRELALKWHPDRKTGDIEKMTAINNEYEHLFEVIKESEINSGNKQAYYWQADDNFREIINTLQNIADISIELVGSWLWIDGNTYPVKDTLKELKFRWSRKKKKWYWFSGIEKSKKRRSSKKSHKEIQAKYGSEMIKKQDKRLALSH